MKSEPPFTGHRKHSDSCLLYTSAVVTDDGYVHGAGYRANGEVHDGFDDHGAVASELGGNMGVRPCVWVETAALS